VTPAPTSGSTFGPPTGTTRLSSQVRRPPRAWPLLPLAPAIVLVMGLAAAAGVGAFGVSHLAVESDQHAAERAELLAATIGARLAKMPHAEWLETIQRAARRTGEEFLILTRDGDIVRDASLGVTDRASLRSVIPAQKGEAITSVGRTRFAIAPLEPPPATHFLVTFVREPVVPEAGAALVRGLFALTTLLVGIAAAVAYAVVRDAQRDVEFVAGRVREMVQVQAEPTGEPVPVRTIDEVGALASAFNQLVGRFAAADLKYREDLERVRSADKDRAGFLAAVSHELRSPLNAILGFADILMTEVDGPLTPNAREAVEQIRGSGQHLAGLISDILEFASLESGQLKLARGPVDLTLLAAEVVREAGVVVGSRPVGVRVEGEPGVVANVDPRRARQVFTNLVGNAVKFTQRGEVVVRVGREGRYARVSVTDTGPGISAAERAMIFEEYKQTPEERRRKRGTGLGLAIARHAVVSMGGALTLSGEPPPGACFRIRLRRVADAR
jgi:signal transduction histidine kinase